MEIHTGDIAAVADTIDGLLAVVFLFIAVVLLLNMMMARRTARRE